MKRKELKSPSLSKDHAPPDELSSRWKSLGEWLTCAVWEDTKEVRQAPTVTIWAQGGQWKCCLRDRDRKLVMWLAAQSLSELVELADSIVLSPDAPWRHDDSANERNGKRVKKSS